MRSVLLFSFVAVVSACNQTTLPPALEVSSANTPVLGVDFTWDQTNGCRDINSPPFTITDVPEGTAFLKFNLYDRNRRAYNPSGSTGFNKPFEHGGGTISYTGADIPLGAFKYDGPCPDSRAHLYVWEVEALDDHNEIIARGIKELPYYRGGTESLEDVSTSIFGI